MAANASSGGNPGEWDSRLGGLCGILFGVLVIATFATSYNFPAGPSEADATLAQFSSLRTAFLAGDIFIGLAVVFAIPYFVGVRNAFEAEIVCWSVPRPSWRSWVLSSRRLRSSGRAGRWVWSRGRSGREG